MDHTQHIDHLHLATARFAQLAGDVSGSETVPSCPGWAVRDLVEHLGVIHRWSAALVLAGQRIVPPTPIVTEPLSSWYSSTADALIAALRAVDPLEPVPNFAKVDERAGFWSRRQLHETTVHAVDLAQALGLDETHWGVLPSIADDGVDEVLHVFFPRMAARGAAPDVRAPIRLVASDTGSSWVIGPGDGPDAPPSRLDPTHRTDSVVTGSATDLYLALWHRVPTDRLSVEGPDAAAFLAGPTTP